MLRFQFLTLHCGDEKSHLVPVLNTILKLSPDETHKLESVAKGWFLYLFFVNFSNNRFYYYIAGGDGQRKWGSYLTGWSSTQ